jgi:hypothetical protein
MRGLHSKAIFGGAFADMFPKAAAKVPKRGFNAPLALYMRELDAYLDVPVRFAIASETVSARRGAMAR